MLQLIVAQHIVDCVDSCAAALTSPDLRLFLFCSILSCPSAVAGREIEIASPVGAIDEHRGLNLFRKIAGQQLLRVGDQRILRTNGGFEFDGPVGHGLTLLVKWRE